MIAVTGAVRGAIRVNPFYAKLVELVSSLVMPVTQSAALHRTMLSASTQDEAHFLAACETEEIEVRYCAAHVREWILAEKSRIGELD